MEKEGIPIYKGLAHVEDVTELPRGPWARMGGYGTFILLEGTKQVVRKLMYVAEIPAGGALEPEKHLYDEVIYILRGRGLAEVWQEGESKRKRTFEWGERSLFTPPMNAWHRLVNGGREPVLFFGTTTAPQVMEFCRSIDFIFNCDYKFTDRYTGRADYFLTSEKRYKAGSRPTWETNFVPDVNEALLDDMSAKAGPGGQITWIRMSGGAMPHISEWPAGRYHKAHFHSAGAVLLWLKSVGYALVWPREYGPHPFQDGHGDKVMKLNLKPGSVYNSGAGPGDWFHQHFNTGPGPARHMEPLSHGGSEADWSGVRSSRKKGGRLVEYEDEDPEIRRMFEEALRQNGVKCAMEPVVYRTDSFKLSS